MNLTTPLGLAVAAVGGARVRRGVDRLFFAEGYRFRFPIAGAFTVGDVVITAHTFDLLQGRNAGVIGHERRHAEQYAVTGLLFFPAYLAGAAWSLLRTGDLGVANPFERHAGLFTGGYVDADGRPTSPVVWTWRGFRPRQRPDDSAR